MKPAWSAVCALLAASCLCLDAVALKAQTPARAGADLSHVEASAKPPAVFNLRKVAAAPAHQAAMSLASIRSYRDGSCATFQCSEGWAPQEGHHNATGNSDKECCEETCRLWTCGKDFVTNVVYFDNIGKSDAMCCDKTCSAVQCQAHYKVPASKQKVAGLTQGDCCQPTCKTVLCHLNTVHIVAKDDTIYNGTGQEDCCVATCAGFHCPAIEDFALDVTKKDVTDPTTDKCCVQTCSGFKCPNGFVSAAEKDTLPGSTTEACCSMTCSGYTCSVGWSKDTSRDGRVGNTNEACCLKECSLFNCSTGWVPNLETRTFVGFDDQTCCQEQCVRHQHDCVEDWAPAPHKETLVGQAAPVCCDKRCSQHRCSGNAAGLRSLIPNAINVTGKNDTTCCEDLRCPALRLKTLKTGYGCNGLSKASCEANFVIMNNTQTGQLTALSCTFREDFGICLTGDPEPTTCVQFDLIQLAAEANYTVNPPSL